MYLKYDIDIDVFDIEQGMVETEGATANYKQPRQNLTISIDNRHNTLMMSLHVSVVIDRSMLETVVYMFLL